MVLCSLKGKSLPYRKPGQTGKVKQPSYNTLTEPFQPWSTNITKDSRKILWTQNTRKWFSPGKLSPIIGLLRKCFIQMKSLSTLPVVPVLGWFCVSCVFERHRFGEKKLVSQNAALRNVHLIWFATHPCVPFFEKQLPSTEFKNYIKSCYVKEDNSKTFRKHVYGYHWPFTQKSPLVRSCNANSTSTVETLVFDQY